ncbi:MAG: IS5/IS1182 family transposase, partial [Burkholderia sp.]
MKQPTLAVAADEGAVFETKRKGTRRDALLDAMERIVPYYPKRGNGRAPIGLERMLRIHFIQHGFNLADLACE